MTEPIYYSTADIAHRLGIQLRTAQDLCNSALRSLEPNKRRRFTFEQVQFIEEYHRRFGRKPRAGKNKPRSYRASVGATGSNHDF